MSLPPEVTWLFWDVNVEAIDVERDRRYVLGRVLERGRLSDVRWAVSVYALSGIRDFFRAGGHPELSRATRAFWKAFFRPEGEEWNASPSFRASSAAPWID